MSIPMQRPFLGCSLDMMPSTYHYKQLQDSLRLQNLQNYLKRMLFLSYQPNALEEPHILEMLAYLNKKQSQAPNPAKLRNYSAARYTSFTQNDGLQRGSDIEAILKKKLFSEIMSLPDAPRKEKTQVKPKQTNENTIKLEEDASESTIREGNVSSSPEENAVPKISASKKISKKATACGHHDRDHYAKGMCCNCYHKKGRNKKPWLCGHDKLYAHGLCQKCYIIKYNAKKATESPAILDQLNLPFFDQFKKKDSNNLETAPNECGNPTLG